ncbi:MAG: ABC transporter substrate-binding protein [Chloroflexi bacterium]|nr:ABC transporter substrate-binding protein [Chloroflexota bacterium]
MSPFTSPSLWRWLLLVLALVGCASPAADAPPVPPTAEPITLRFIGVPNGIGYELDSELLAGFTAETGIQVEFVPGPESTTERIAQYEELLQSQSPTVDVYQIDVIWPGLLAEHMVDLAPHFEAEIPQYFPTIIENNTVDGRLIGIPFFTDAGLLYYRTDLLDKYGYDAPPATWDELERMASVIQIGEREEGNVDFWGYVWQGAAYEGLTCNALEWQASSGGGVIVEADGRVNVNNPAMLAALEQAAGWVGTISPLGVTGFQEEDARSVWQAGNAAFMRNWPYAYAFGQESNSIIKDQFAITVLPSGGERHADTLGGWQLAVSKYSAYPEEAIALVRYMTSPEVQAQRAIRGSYVPTIPALYSDAAVLAANPFFADLQDVFVDGAVARPSTVTSALYNDVSRAYFAAIHQALTGDQTAAQALADLEIELQTILNQ